VESAALLAAMRDEFALGTDVATYLRAVMRLILAAGLAAVLGFDRERRESPAGLRTYMLVGVGACLFVLAPAMAGLSRDELGRVLQGVVAGIGFLGAGAIIKVSEREQVKGLTTAAGIWATAAIGITVALGLPWLAIFVTALSYAVLAFLTRVEARIGERAPPT
jgi:putative Mg2+ transporter-C (MgtC) family protein